MIPSLSIEPPAEPLKAEFPWRGQTAAQLLLALEQEAVVDSGQCCLWENAAGSSTGASHRGVHQPGRYVYIGLETRHCLRVHHGLVHLGRSQEHDKRYTRPLQDYGWNPLKALQHYLDETRASTESYFAQAAAGTMSAFTSGPVFNGSEALEEPPFRGGWTGYLSYDASRYFEHIEGMEGHPSEPDLMVRFVDRLLVLDTVLERAYLYVWPNNWKFSSAETTEADFFRLEEGLRKVLAMDLPEPLPAVGDVEVNPRYAERFSREEFVAIVKRAREYIGAGDVFQVVLSNSFSMKHSPDPVDVYGILRQSNPSPYHFLLPCGSFSLVGASPEVMLRSWRDLESGEQQVDMRLVAGTYPRGKSPEEDEALKRALAGDEKELAEHIMLVDHCRNDLGRTAKIGSVQVSDLCCIEPYKTVFHMVSEVSASPAPGESALSVLASCFPIATLTGTPKIRAMEIIAELEGPHRGAFGGAAFQLGFDGFLDSTVIIRTAAISRSGTLLRAGAGIVYDSQPEREYDECLWKAEALGKAVAAATRSEEAATGRLAVAGTKTASTTQAA